MSDSEKQSEDKSLAHTSPAFPDWFPDGCPSSSMQDALGDVYRIVKANPFADADFHSHHEMGTGFSADPCTRCAVSVFSSLESARHRQRLSPHLGAFISKGNLRPAHGKAGDANKAGHISWWPYISTARPSCFEEAIPCT
jgi:hypothetical protein